MASIAAPSMSCEANRPLASHSERNRNQTRVKNDPAFTMPACLLTVTGRCMRRWLCENGGGCTIRTHGRPEATGCFQNSCNKPLCQSSSWMRRKGFEPPTSCLWGKRATRLLHRAIFRLPFVKERWYYRIHHWESQWQKIHPAVCGRQGAPLWRNEPAKNKVGTSPRRSQRNQLEFAVALASEDVSVGSMVAVIFEWRRVFTTPK